MSACAGSPSPGYAYFQRT